MQNYVAELGVRLQWP